MNGEIGRRKYLGRVFPYAVQGLTATVLIRIKAAIRHS